MHILHAQAIVLLAELLASIPIPRVLVSFYHVGGETRYGIRKTSGSGNENSFDKENDVVFPLTYKGSIKRSQYLANIRPTFCFATKYRMVCHASENKTNKAH